MVKPLECGREMMIEELKIADHSAPIPFVYRERATQGHPKWSKGVEEDG